MNSEVFVYSDSDARSRTFNNENQVTDPNSMELYASQGTELKLADILSKRMKNKLDNKETQQLIETEIIDDQIFVYGDESTLVYLSDNLSDKFCKIIEIEAENESNHPSSPESSHNDVLSQNYESDDSDAIDRSESNNCPTAQGSLTESVTDQERLLDRTKDDLCRNENGTVSVVKNLDAYQGIIRDCYVYLTRCDQVNFGNNTTSATTRSSSSIGEDKRASNVFQTVNVKMCKCVNVKSSTRNKNLEKYPRTSKLWQYVTHIEIDTVQCNFCLEQFLYKDLSILRKHLFQRHSILVSDLIRQLRQPNTRKRSRVWNYFTQRDKTSAECNLCHGRYANRSLKRHLRLKHALFSGEQIFAKKSLAGHNPNTGLLYMSKYFTKHSNGIAICNLCSTQISYQKGAANLRRHYIRRHHRLLFNPALKKYTSICSPTRHDQSNTDKTVADKAEEIFVEENSNHVDATPNDKDSRQYFPHNDKLDVSQKSSNKNKSLTKFFRINVSTAKCKLCSKYVWYKGITKRLINHLRLNHTNKRQNHKSNSVTDFKDKQTNDVWRFFKKLNDNSAICKLCVMQIPSNYAVEERLIYHLYIKHSSDFTLSYSSRQKFSKALFDSRLYLILNSAVKLRDNVKHIENIGDNFQQDRSPKKISAGAITEASIARKPGRTWSNFTKIDRGLAQCNICKETISYARGSTDILTLHLDVRHSEDGNQNVPPVKENSVDVVSESEFESYMVDIKQEIVSDEEILKEDLEDLKSRDELNGKKIKKEIPSISLDVLTEVRKYFSTVPQGVCSNSKFVTLVCDTCLTELTMEKDDLSCLIQHLRVVHHRKDILGNDNEPSENYEMNESYLEMNPNEHPDHRDSNEPEVNFDKASKGMESQKPKGNGSRIGEETIWIYYELLNIFKVKCKLCTEEISYKGRLTYLKKHLHMRHRGVSIDVAPQSRKEGIVKEHTFGRRISSSGIVENSTIQVKGNYILNKNNSIHKERSIDVTSQSKEEGTVKEHILDRQNSSSSIFEKSTNQDERNYILDKNNAVQLIHQKRFIGVTSQSKEEGIVEDHIFNIQNSSSGIVENSKSQVKSNYNLDKNDATRLIHQKRSIETTPQSKKEGIFKEHIYDRRNSLNGIVVNSTNQVKSNYHLDMNNAVSLIHKKRLIDVTPQPRKEGTVKEHIFGRRISSSSIVENSMIQFKSNSILDKNNSVQLIHQKRFIDVTSQSKEEGIVEDHIFNRQNSPSGMVDNQVKSNNNLDKNNAIRFIDQKRIIEVTPQSMKEGTVKEHIFDRRNSSSSMVENCTSHVKSNYNLDKNDAIRLSHQKRSIDTTPQPMKEGIFEEHIFGRWNSLSGIVENSTIQDKCKYNLDKNNAVHLIHKNRSIAVTSQSNEEGIEDHIFNRQYSSSSMVENGTSQVRSNYNLEKNNSIHLIDQKPFIDGIPQAKDEVIIEEHIFDRRNSLSGMVQNFTIQEKCNYNLDKNDAIHSIYQKQSIDATLLPKKEGIVEEHIFDSRNSLSSMVENSMNQDNINYNLDKNNATVWGELVLSYFENIANIVKCKICLKFFKYTDKDISNLSNHVWEEHIRKFLSLNPFPESMKGTVQNDQSNTASIEIQPLQNISSYNYKLNVSKQQSDDSDKKVTKQSTAEQSKSKICKTWDYFELADKNDRMKCKLCNSLFSFEESITVLTSHLLCEHSSIFAEDETSSKGDDHRKSVLQQNENKLCHYFSRQRTEAVINKRNFRARCNLCSRFVLHNICNPEHYLRSHLITKHSNVISDRLVNESPGSDTVTAVSLKCNLEMKYKNEMANRNSKVWSYFTKVESRNKCKVCYKFVSSTIHCSHKIPLMFSLTHGLKRNPNRYKDSAAGKDSWHYFSTLNKHKTECELCSKSLINQNDFIYKFACSCNRKDRIFQRLHQNEENGCSSSYTVQKDRKFSSQPKMLFLQKLLKTEKVNHIAICFLDFMNKSLCSLCSDEVLMKDSSLLTYLVHLRSKHGEIMNSSSKEVMGQPYDAVSVKNSRNKEMTLACSSTPKDKVIRNLLPQFQPTPFR